MERQRSFDEPSNARGCVEVAHIAFDRADGAEILLLRPGTEGRGESFNFNRIAKWCACAVRFHIADGVGGEAGHRLGRGYRFRLSLDARRGISDLLRTIVIDGKSFDDGENLITLSQRFLQPFQHHDAHPFARDSAGCAGVERAAMSVRRGDAAFLIEMAAFLRERDGNRPSQGHVALVAEQVLTGDAHCNQRCRAGGLYVQTRSAQIEFVGDARRKVIFVIGEHDLVFVELRQEFGLTEQNVREIRVHAHAREYPDGPLISSCIAAGALQGLPCAFKEDTVLRVHHLGFARIDSEEITVEQVGVVENTARFDVAGTVLRDGHSCGSKIFLREK